MANSTFLSLIVTICGLLTLCASEPKVDSSIILPTCPAPSELMLKCLGQYACQHAIRLDLRCLLNLNGTPLLGGLLGGTGLLGGGNAGGGGGGLGGLLGGGGGLLGGGGSGGGTGIVGGLLGR